MYNTESDQLYSRSLGDMNSEFSEKLWTHHAKAIKNLKKGIFLYFWLILAEGALRKWVLPQLATPLLVIRDPVALWIFGYAFMNGLFKSNIYLNAIYVVSLLAFINTMILGHANIGIALYGLRIMIIHLPLAFLIGSLMNYDDVLKLGRGVLWAIIIETVLISFQFYSPQSAWVNKGIGGVEVIGFTGGLDFFRPSGTFSFTNGLSSFYGFAAPFVFFFWISGEKVNKLVLIAATAALIMAVPLSISRTVLFEVGLSAAFIIVVAARNPKMMIRVLIAFVGIAVLFVLLGNFSVFNTGMAALTDRTEKATDFRDQGVAGTVLDRVLGGMLGVIALSDKFPLWGLGIGLGTNVGAKLLTGEATFLFAEGEWGRIVGEMGIILGIIFVFIRLFFTINMAKRSYKALAEKNYLPWMLLSFSLLAFLQGQWAQPTSLGFSIFSAGATMAAMNRNRELTA